MAQPNSLFGGLSNTIRRGAMATLPTAVSYAKDTLEERFRHLETKLYDDLKDDRSKPTVVNHPTFHKIIKLGEAVVPLMLQDLDNCPRIWVWALPEITGVDLVAPCDDGNIPKMSLAWLTWASERGYKTKGIEDRVPSLKGLAYEVTGPRDTDYNCIAWAVGVTDEWWSPSDDPQTKWPDDVPRENTLVAYQAVFESLGYAV